MAAVTSGLAGTPLSVAAELTAGVVINKENRISAWRSCLFIFRDSEKGIRPCIREDRRVYGWVQGIDTGIASPVVSCMGASLIALSRLETSMNPIPRRTFLRGAGVTLA